MTEDGVVEVASSLDIFATKLKVLLQRVESKDYRDIYALIEAGESLEAGLGAAQAIYGSQFQPAEALKALTYFEGGDLDKLAELERECLVEAASRVTQIPSVPVISRSLSAYSIQR